MDVTTFITDRKEFDTKSRSLRSDKHPEVNASFELQEFFVDDDIFIRVVGILKTLHKMFPLESNLIDLVTAVNCCVVIEMKEPDR